MSKPTRRRVRGKPVHAPDQMSPRIPTSTPSPFTRKPKPPTHVGHTRENPGPPPPLYLCRPLAKWLTQEFAPKSGDLSTEWDVAVVGLANLTPDGRSIDGRTAKFIVLPFKRLPAVTA